MRKIPTLFQRDPNDMARVLPDVHPDCRWVLAGEGRPTRKYDGTCVMLDEHGAWWARREVKADRQAPANFVAVEHDEVTGKTVGWEPIGQSGFAKFHAEALAAHAFLGGTERFSMDAADLLPGTFELVGPKINRNPEGVDDHMLIAHGYRAAVDYDEMAVLASPTPLFPLGLTFDGIHDWLHAHPGWEGLVWHHPDGRMAKIKGRDFPSGGGR